MSGNSLYKPVVDVLSDGRTEIQFKAKRGSGSATIEEPVEIVHFSSPDDAIQFFSNIIEKIKKAK